MTDQNAQVERIAALVAQIIPVLDPEHNGICTALQAMTGCILSTLWAALDNDVEVEWVRAAVQYVTDNVTGGFEHHLALRDNGVQGKSVH